MAKAEPVFLDLDELLVNGERLARPKRFRERQLALSVRQDFTEMAGGGHLQL
jgi:hypothetical protein